MLVSYESLKRNHKATVETIASFLSYSLTPDTLDKIVEQTAFDAVKENPAANMFWVDKITLNGNSAKFLRKGIIGDWESHFTEDQATRMECTVKEKLLGIGLDFEY